MRLLHLSDTHLHRPGAPTHHPDIDAADRLDRVLEATITRGAVDLICLTGDICDDGSLDGAEQVRDRLAAAYPGVPIAAVPGNHDETAAITAVFGAPPQRLGGWHVLATTTNEPERIEGVAAPVSAALAQVPDGVPLLLLQHHPIRSRSTHPWFTLVGADELDVALAARSGVTVVLTGHTHEAYAARAGRVHHLGAPSTYYAIEHDGQLWSFAQEGTGAQLVTLGEQCAESVEFVGA